MPSGNFASPLRAPPLTLRALLGAIAGLALAFAILPLDLSVPLAVAVSGILALQGMRLPVITKRAGARRWLPWVAWSLMLAACPVAIGVVGVMYPRAGPPAFTGPRPWATRVVDALFYCQLAVSVAASWSVVFLVRDGRRWIAWGAIVAVGVFTFFIACCAIMVTTGVYL